MTDRTGDRAVVLGGSMAGLLAARVLADHYTDVRVLDRDDLAVADGARRGVPQARHIHILLARGRQVLEDLFPGLTSELEAAGVPTWDLTGDTRTHFSGHRLRQGASDMITISPDRAFLEDRVRDRVRRLPQVTFADPCDVLGLRTSSDARRVTGVQLLRRADGSAEEVLEADLVVDALGRGSRTPAWLESLGYESPTEERVRMDLGYTTRLYRLPADALGGVPASIIGPTPEHPRGGALNRLEGDRWMLTLAGLLGDHPPTDHEGFVAFARSLQFPDFHDVIKDAEPLTEPVAYRFPESVRRRYERLDSFPQGFLVVGDSVCSFNPIYGQGMTVAALEALELQSHLAGGALPEPRRFFRSISRVIDTPWEMASGGDLAFPGAEGRRTPKLRMATAYITRLHAAAAHDARLAVAFGRVQSLVDPPEALMRPGVMVRVLRHRQRRPPATSGVDGSGRQGRPATGERAG